MIVEFMIPPGEPATTEELRLQKALALANALAQDQIEYSSLIEVRKAENAEIVVFDVEVEMPQLRTHPVNPSERIAVVFFDPDEVTPEVLLLRADFPQVPHINLRDYELPRSLCLYEETYHGLKRRWTPHRFVERIREWLALTAKGKLHQEDQPLEPLLSGQQGHIVLPNDLLDTGRHLPEKLHASRRGERDEYLFLVAQRDEQASGSLNVLSSVHRCQAQEHGIIRRCPSTISNLNEFATSGGCDLLAELRTRLIEWWKTSPAKEDFLESRLVLIIVCPKVRAQGLDPESTDVWAFVTLSSVYEVGQNIGIWERNGKHFCPLIIPDASKDGNNIELGLLNTSFDLTRADAARLNGQEAPVNQSVAAIGLGALGSQVTLNLAKSGFGRWILIDNDRLMPHNVARHALGGLYVGWEKACTVAFEANTLISDDKLFSAIPANVILPGKHVEDVTKALVSADMILDMSASVTVARHLALDINSNARRISLFLSPTGRDLVMISEDSLRSMQLDSLEMQYYRSIVNSDLLSDHLKVQEGRRRYGRSCSDITSTLSQELVALHAAIGSRAIRKLTASEEAVISIWRADEDGSVHRINILPEREVRYHLNNWTISIDEGLFRKLDLLRTGKLPKETGGVLLGSFDLERNIAYIVDSVPSPPDSKEWPTLYIRGCSGLRKKVEDIKRKTNEMVDYVGEWHSHPAGASTAPSTDDLKVFAWLTEHMGRSGLPALMMIIGDPGRSSCFIGEIKQVENMIPRMEPHE